MVELIGKIEFAKVALNKGSKSLEMHVVVLKAEASIHPVRVAQIAAPEWDKVSIKIAIEYTDFSNVFSSDLPMKLPKNTGTNDYAIELVEEK